jgi:hypothetical protein
MEGSIMTNFTILWCNYPMNVYKLYKKALTANKLIVVLKYALYASIFFPGLKDGNQAFQMILLAWAVDLMIGGYLLCVAPTPLFKQNSFQNCFAYCYGYIIIPVGIFGCFILDFFTFGMLLYYSKSGSDLAVIAWICMSLLSNSLLIQTLLGFLKALKILNSNPNLQPVNQVTNPFLTGFPEQNNIAQLV